MHDALEPDPSEADAAALVVRALGKRPIEVTRFATGLQHFVFDCRLPDGTSVVARLTRPRLREVLASGVRWSDALRPRGLPLPAILHRELEARLPGVLLQRLPGCDLGAVIGGLADSERQAVAREVSRWQAMVGDLPPGTGYGYALHGAAPPHRRWSDVLATHLARSGARSAASGRGDDGLIRTLGSLIEVRRPMLDAVPATAFLHDATTKNVIVDRGRAVGLVDVDDLCFGDPRWTVALTLASLIAHRGPLAYAHHLLVASGGAADIGFALYVALFACDLLSEIGNRFNRAQPIDDAGAVPLQATLPTLLAGAAGKDARWFDGLRLQAERTGVR